MSSLLLEKVLGSVQVPTAPYEDVRDFNTLLFESLLHACKKLVKISGFVILT